MGWTFRSCPDRFYRMVGTFYGRYECLGVREGLVVGTEGVSSGLSGQPLNHWGSALGSPAAFPVVSSGFEWAQVVAKRPLKPTQVVSVVAERTPPVVSVVMECAPKRARSAH